MNGRDLNGLEYEHLPSYFAVRILSMAMGSPASVVLGGTSINCVKATQKFDEEDRKKLVKSGAMFPVTDETGTSLHSRYTSWKSDNKLTEVIPSIVRCVMLSDNDLARKWDIKLDEIKRSGFSPQVSALKSFVASVMDSHINPSTNWITEYGEIEVTVSGASPATYKVNDIIPQSIPETVLGETIFISE